MTTRTQLARRILLYLAVFGLLLLPRTIWEQVRFLLSDLVGARQAVASTGEPEARLERLRLDMAVLRRENHRLERELRAVTALEARFPGLEKRELIPATVVARSASSGIFRRWTIDRGSRDGIRRGMVVLAGDLVIGLVGEVTGRRAIVILTADPTSCLRVRNDRTGQEGLLKGAVDDLVFEPADPRSPLATGDLLLTSATSTRVPGGLPVARIASLDKDPDFRAVQGRGQPFYLSEGLAVVAVLARTPEGEEER